MQSIPKGYITCDGPDSGSLCKQLSGLEPLSRIWEIIQQPFMQDGFTLCHDRIEVELKSLLFLSGCQQTLHSLIIRFQLQSQLATGWQATKRPQGIHFLKNRFRVADPLNQATFLIQAGDTLLITFHQSIQKY